MEGSSTRIPADRAALYRAAVRVLFAHDLGVNSRDESSGTVETDEISLKVSGTADRIYFRIRVLADDGSIAVRLTNCEKGVRGFIVQECPDGEVPEQLASLYDQLIADIRTEATKESH